MRAWIARMTEDNIDQSAIEKAGEILKNGGLAAFPTETVYGLGGNALDAKASEKIYAAKGRPSDNPLIVHIGRMEDLETVAANVPESARKLAAACWPGPLTMIFEKTNAVPLETTGGLTSVAVRYPSNKVANALILAGGGFIAAPSANTSGRPSPTKVEHVIEDLGDKIDCIIDGGGDTVLGRGPSFFNHCTLSSYGAFMWIRNTKENHGNIFYDCTFKALGNYAVIARLPDNKGKNYPDA